MSDVNMDVTAGVKPQAQASRRNPASMPSPSTIEARAKIEAIKYFDQTSQASSPSIASTMAGPAREDQPSGEELQAVVKRELMESGLDYAQVFDELQIKLEHHDEVVTGIIHPIRAKRIKNLKTATAAMIRDLSSTFIRGYGTILYKKQAEKWLVDDSELQLAGKTRLQFTPGDVRIGGPNAHFYAILEPMWWIMRGIVFELKPAPKRQGQSKENVDVDDGYLGRQDDVDTEMDTEDLPYKEKGVAARPRGRPAKAAKTAKAPKIRFEEKRQKALERIEQEMDLSKQNGGRVEKYRMTAEETDGAVQELIVRLHGIRCKSDPKAFERSWVTNLARLDEIETIGELKVKKSVELVHEGRDEALVVRTREQEENTPFKKVKLSGPAPAQIATTSGQIVTRPATLAGTVGTIYSTSNDGQAPARTLSVDNLTNEPFNTTGPPSILNRLRLGETPLIPSAISIYITANPPLSPYSNGAYHWPSAPIGIADCKRLFDGIDQRVDVIKISGYTFSYGWDDVMRAVDATDQGKGHGFRVLLQDVADAARMGVTMWRLKVLVRGVAPGYQSRV